MSGPDLYLIAHIGHTIKDHEHITWWKPESRGYTICVDKAGRYGLDEARGNCLGGECIAVPVAKAQAIALTTPYYRRGNGTLGQLYDGGPHSPVPNSADAWRHLLDSRVLWPSVRILKPTPMSASKARAIYLTGFAPVGKAATSGGAT